MRINNFTGLMGLGTPRLPDRIKSGKADLTAAIQGSGGKSRWDSYLEQVKEQAQKDAASGVYMSDQLRALEDAYLARYISPNRAKAIAQVNGMLNTVARANRSGQSILSLYGLPYSTRIQKGLTRTTAAVFDQNGEMIAAYHSDNGYWVSWPTKAETSAGEITGRTYLEAYRAAKAELAAQAQGGVDVRG